MDQPWPQSGTIFGDFNEDAPNTAHILWAKPMTMGGLAGGPLTEPWGFEESDAYEPKWTGTVVLGGVLFYNQFESTGSETGLERAVVAVDLHTGEELWKRPLIDPDGNHRRLDFGQLFFWDSYNYHGAFPYLWTAGGGYWNAYDAYTGRWEYSMQGVPGGTRLYGPKGEIFIYTFDLNDGWMTFWNSSRVVSNQGSWRPHGQVYDAEETMEGIEWNVTIPTDLPGTVDEIRGNIALGTNFDKYSRSEESLSMWAISLEPGHEGALLYNRTWATPIPYGHYDVQDASAEDDVFAVSCAQLRQHWGFRLSTGMEIWGPTEEQHYTDKWGYTSSNSWDLIHYGKYFTGNYGGILRCFDVQTGEKLWDFEVTDYYSENLHNNAWRFRPAFFADGKIYIENTEHNPFNPQHRQAPIVAIDVETGEEVFRLPYRSSEWSSTTLIADSIMACFNTYDLRVYGIGKGPSAVTIEAPLQASEWGQEIMLRGTVTDISPGTQTAAMKMRFPNGVPAVADEHMTDWMQHVYNQFGMPMASGVPVKLEVVVDPNGNWYDIGTAYTDASGFYNIAWEPPVPGPYLILASFEGSESYYPSYIETAIVVDEGLAPGSLMESDLPTATGSQQVSLISNEVAILASIAIFSLIGLAALSFLRKQE
jgi:outer membrane protein assembly factor BamB